MQVNLHTATNQKMCKKHFLQCESYDKSLTCSVCSSSNDDTSAWVPVNNMVEVMTRTFIEAGIELYKEPLTEKDWICKDCAQLYIATSSNKSETTIQDDLKSNNVEVQSFAKSFLNAMELLKDRGYVFLMMLFLT